MKNPDKLPQCIVRVSDGVKFFLNPNGTYSLKDGKLSYAMEWSYETLMVNYRPQFKIWTPEIQERVERESVEEYLKSLEDKEILEWKTHPDSFEGFCERCGAQEILIRQLDPYLKEIDNIEEDICFCRKCYHERLDDI